MENPVQTTMMELRFGKTTPEMMEEESITPPIAPGITRDNVATSLRGEDLRARLSLIFASGALPLYDLQLFAAEDEGRTEDPTERRRREERDKGNVPKSQDIAQSAVLVATVLTLFFLGTWMYRQSLHVFEKYLGSDYTLFQQMQQEDVRIILISLFWETAKIVAPILAVAFVMGIVSNVAQVGLLFTLQPLEFKPERILPDFKRILPVRRTIYNLAKIMVQFAFISVAAYLVVVDDFIPMLKSSNVGLPAAVGLFAWVSFKLLIIISILLFLLAIPDYFYQRFEYMENLKMTVSELKRERKEEEGDPMLRQRQRERGMELRNQRNMLREVPKADVVITNPTHFAVALRYDTESAQAPVVIAKGSDHLAFQIRTIARENGVPIQENPQLARVLYRDVEIGQEIPETLYRVVSLVFSKLEKFRRMQAGV